MKPTPNVPIVYTAEAEGDLRRQTRLFTGLPLINAVLDAVSVGMVGLNRRLRIVVHNQAFLELVAGGTGSLAAVEVVGRRIGEAFHCLYQEEAPEGCGTSEHCPRCGALQSIFASLGGTRDTRECQITRLVEGRLRSMDLRVTSVPVRVQEEDFTLFSLTDIGHEKRRRALEKVFFHDILNTASQIQHGAALARSPAAPESKSPDILEALAVQLVSEIRGQRDLLAAEDNELSIQPSPVDSLRLLEDLRRQLTHPAAAMGRDGPPGRELRIDPASRRVAFISDPTLLTRVLTNMARNALEATGSGGAVVLSCREVDGGQVEFQVRNPDYIPRDVQLGIFQRSFSTKGRDRGLGTYSMRLLSEQYLKGKVSFTSSREGGTVFTARYPLNVLKEEGEAGGAAPGGSGGGRY